MKYKLINSVSKIETICDKITIDEFDYYVSDERIKELKPNDKYHTVVENPRRIVQYSKYIQDTFSKVVIATNNPDIDIPKVIDVVEKLAYDWLYEEETERKASQGYPLKPMEYGFIKGYNKSQKTYPFKLDDVKEIINLAREQYWDIDNRGFSSNTDGDWSFKYSTEDEIIQKYQETKVLTIFYE